ncbi:hypothetical protein DPMN_040246 [Dreissena polymorpha]|uniref:Uncharacterized protein n=1 Tax=Dreissena polymorpha TaxID=45954 RepID=A0A9D4HWP4_DREPO|nr:hypothetical protein DPMN_040246 [Dreissena polymorpha]
MAADEDREEEAVFLGIHVNARPGKSSKAEQTETGSQSQALGYRSTLILLTILTSGQHIHQRLEQVQEERVITLEPTQLLADWSTVPYHATGACFVGWSPALHSPYFSHFGMTPHSEGVVSPQTFCRTRGSTHPFSRPNVPFASTGRLRYATYSKTAATKPSRRTPSKYKPFLSNPKPLSLTRGCLRHATYSWTAAI